MNINEVKPRLALKLTQPLRNILKDLGYSLPENYQPQISLLNANGRKTKSNAAANNWSPETGGIEIWFAPVTPETKQPTAESAHANVDAPNVQALPSKNYVHPAEAELLRALDRAESRPGWNFVPLKKFRDEILPAEHCPSMRTDVEQHNMLRSVIEKRFVLVGKVPNPKSPQFPVTTIRLNRLLPDVKAALGQADDRDGGFQPVEIRGEPLSATILRERR